jgi:N-hydroxyarylamine O-acetyltransferase
MQQLSHSLSPEVVEAVLAKLGFSSTPDATLESLQKIYARWCDNIPFCNARKLIALREGKPGPFPGDSAEDFFAAWVKHGTGGTCWAGNGALCTLLQDIGFNARRGIGTMMVAPGLPPNHGTVVVNFGGQDYLVDASILHGDPLLLHEDESIVDHPAWGVKCRPVDDTWVIGWRPQLRPEGLDCHINSLDISAEQFSDFHEGTRGWSPFNYELSIRANRKGGVVGVAFGKRVDFTQSGELMQTPLEGEARMRLLVDVLGYSEEIAAQIPADIPTPPPPGSKTAGGLTT